VRRALPLLALAALLPAAAAGAASAAVRAAEAAAYARCAVCHLPGGEGLPGAVPPLVGPFAALAADARGRAYLALVAKFGLAGPIESGGARYLGVMPAQHAALDDAALAAALNHILRELNGARFDGRLRPFSAAEIARIEAQHPGASPRANAALRASLAEGLLP